jgi:uncharacterized DUF497 family protein
MEFDWAPEKAAQNLRKHGVPFDEAATVFGDFLGITVSDPDHSIVEHRYVTVGRSERGRLLIVSHMEEDERIRIISSRMLTRAERLFYEESYK